MMLFLGYVFLQLGCVSLSMVLVKHFRQFFPRQKLTNAKKALFNIVGYSLLLAGLTCFFQVSDFAIALTTFFAVLTLCILLWSMLMAWRR